MDRVIKDSLCRPSSSRPRSFKVFCTTASLELFFLLGRLGAMTDTDGVEEQLEKTINYAREK